MQERQRHLNSKDFGSGPVVIWLDRDERAIDHWGLHLAQQEALQRHQPLIAVSLIEETKDVLPRSARFRLQGLLETAADLQEKNIPLQILSGSVRTTLLPFLKSLAAAAIYCDFTPLRQGRASRDFLAEKLACPLIEVDSHNVVPCWLAMPKKAYAAHHFRRAMERQLNHFLTPIPFLQQHPFRQDGLPFQIPPAQAILTERLHRIPAFDRWQAGSPGTAGGLKQLRFFLKEGLPGYENRNDPNQKVVSQLSPWLHFGQIAPQRVALEVRRQHTGQATRRDGPAAAFLEQLIIRRELSDNFCYYNPQYDQFAGFPDWARQTLQEHRADPRAKIYTPATLEAANTDDDLWNAAQDEMKLTGYMPGYLRMYWAKKILEWTPDPESALQTAIDLNDRYLLDGRDPNGYTGIAWSIGGVHDRPFAARFASGKIRPMTFAGCRRKFNVAQYIEKIERLKKEY